MSIHFSSPRIVIVDDKNDEAMPMIDAFSALNIPVVKFGGMGTDGSPKKPLNHVRLLILDLWLGTSGFDAKNTAGVILRTVAPTLSSGPCIVLVWSYHPDDLEEVKNALDHYNNSREPVERVEPLAWITLRKLDFQKDDEFNAKTLMDRVSEELNKLGIIELLLEWEALCAEAASLAIDRILAFSHGQGKSDFETRNKLLMTALESLAEASVGKQLPANPSSAVFKKALFRSLAYIHEDAVHNLITYPQDSSTLYPAPYSGELKTMIATLNTVLLTTQESSPEVPGAVSSIKDLNIPAMPFKFDSKDKNYTRFIHSIYQKNYRKVKKGVLELCEPVILEVTPACDYAQEKRKRLRFAPGLLAPKDLFEELPERADNIRSYGPLVHEGNICWLILESLHFFTLPSDVTLHSPLFRLRSHVYSDIQAWLGGHMSRPGHISMKPRGILPR